MIPGLDIFIKQRMAAIGGTASQAKLQILREANAEWIARGKPHQTMNPRIWLSSGGGPADDYAALVAQDGAIHYWKLDEASGLVAVDSIGGVNGAISAAGVSLGQPGGIPGTTAMAFDGTTGQITVPPITAINQVAALSAEIWARLAVLSGTRVAILLGATTTNSNLAANQTTTQWYWELSTFESGAKRVTAPTLDLLWHHFVLTYDNANLRLYRDAVLTSTVPLTGLTDIAGNLLLGQFAGAGSAWNGLISQVAIYPVALTAAQVAAHYAAAGVGVRSITAGQPGTFSPTTAPVPTFAVLQGMKPPRVNIAPLSPWPVADWVTAAGGEACSWTGSQWVVKP